MLPSKSLNQTEMMVLLLGIFPEGFHMHMRQIEFFKGKRLTYRCGQIHLASHAQGFRDRKDAVLLKHVVLLKYPFMQGVLLASYGIQ